MKIARDWLIVLSITLGLIAVIEFGFRVSDPRSLEFNLSYPPNYKQLSSYGIYRPTPGKHVAVSMEETTPYKIYEVAYTINSDGGRITSLEGGSVKEKYALFLGGSFTYGEGVQDLEALPSRVAEYGKDIKTYNYGFHGFGPFEAMALAENFDFDSVIAEREGFVIYTFINAHHFRIRNSLTNASWRSEFAHYDLAEDGEFVRNGSFLSAHPIQTRAFKILEKSEVRKKLGVSYPPEQKRKDFEYAARALQSVKLKLEKHFRKSGFYVLIYPGTKRANLLTESLENLGVNYLDYSRLFDVGEPRFHVSRYDVHPSAEAYEILAKQVVVDLGLN